MNKYIKSIIFISIIVLCGVFLLVKENLDFEENVYVISESEEKYIDTPQNDSQEKNKAEVLDNEVSSKKNNNKMVTIFVSGEVNKPGVVSLESDKRLSDAVEELGGFTIDADLNKINLAIKVEDEKHYIIPKIGEDVVNNLEDLSNDINSNDINVDQNKKQESNKVNINTATIQELDILPGVGESTANKIINYREENGKFNTIEEIKNVNGIGDKKYEDIKDIISVN